MNIGDSELEAPEWADAQDQAGVAYVRTYDVELAPSPSGASSLAAVVRHVRAFGPSCGWSWTWWTAAARSKPTSRATGSRAWR